MNNIILQEDLNRVLEKSKDIGSLKNTNIFVTGATGLVGSLLVKALLTMKNVNIIALVRNLNKAKEIYNEDFNKITFLCSDIINKITYSGDVDYIFHCASVTTSKIMVTKPVETLMTSVVGTRNVLEFAKEKKCKSVVYVSSMEMYGIFNSLEHDIKEENLGYIDPLKVRSNYPESKRLCENMCIAYLSEYDVHVKIARLAQTFGPGILSGENRVFAQFARSVINGEDIVLHTRGLSEGNYCYTRDTLIGLLTILLKGKDGEAYNVSNPDTHTTIANMAHMVADIIAEKKIKVVFDVPEDNIFGYAEDTKMKLNSEKLQMLGWKPEVGLEEAYRRLIASMK